jgi:hypothetical protein
MEKNHKKKRVMKRNLTLALFVAGCLMTVNCYAQKVIVEGNKVIVDASALRNITTENKATGTDGTTWVKGSNNASNIGSQVSNEKVYYKFEVSKVDNTNDKSNNLGGLNWVDAVNLCKDLNLDGTGWRLPTQRELQLIHILRWDLEARTQEGFTEFGANYVREYWSATEYSESVAAVLYFETSITHLYSHFSGKNSTHKVRCIREL